MEYNTCAKLTKTKEYQDGVELYKKLLQEGKSPNQFLLDLQKELQKNLAKRLPEFNQDPDTLFTIGEKVDWIKKNYDAIDDERRELLTAMGGMSNGEKAATSVWKAWKSNHGEMRKKLFEDYSDDDKAEIWFEMIDLMHFMNNIMIGLEMDDEQIFAMYFAKNAENAKRYKEGY